MKLSLKLDKLRASAPNGPTRYGQLYAAKSETKWSYSQITLHTLFVSEENSHLIRPHVFKKERPMTAAEWHAWLAKNLEHIHKTAVLPGLAIRTSKSWAVQRIIGWTGDVKHKFNAAAMAPKRHPAKRQRRKNG